MSSDRNDVNRVEACLLAGGGETMGLAAISKVSGVRDPRPALETLRDEYAERSLVLVAGEDGFAIRTRPEYSDLARLVLPEPRPFGRAAMQTLAVVALYGPVTRSEIERHRGVGLSSGVLESIVDRGLVAPGPRRDTPGRPMTWMVTQAYMDTFSISRSDLVELGRAAAEDPVDEEIERILEPAEAISERSGIA